ncbi:MAG: endolytic transglycosylase MltG [Pseudomonadota bacterium]|nr:endolytic transglycosylase MltG [Pseudomonadota bacterium]
MTRLLLVVIVLLALAAALAWHLWTRSETPGPLIVETTVIIQAGTDMQSIAADLVKAGVVERATEFILLARIEKADRRLSAGEFAFPARVSMRQALDILMRGRTVAHAVTIPEGLTSADILTRLASEQVLVGEMGDHPSEGSLLPETYHVSRGETRMALIERMRADMDAVVRDLWAGRDPDLPFKTTQEAVILASIVEKETSTPSEYARISGVFVNRLEHGMRLQSDPTVIYALTDGHMPLGRALHSADLKIDSPFNTYRVAGLPPAPICHPGRETLRAVLHPARHDELYFVADGSGGHRFSKTLAAHKRNVANWRKVRAAQRLIPRRKPEGE